MTKSPPIHEQNLPAYYQEDEINLVDLWLVLEKRKLVLVGVAVACVLAGLLYAVVVPRSYQYSTSIEIGTRLSGTELTVMESPETVLAKVKESYIPLAQQDNLVTYPELKSVVEIDVRVPKGSQIIVLSSKGPEDEGDIHKALQQSVVGMLKKDHGRIVDVLRKETEILQHRAVAKLEELRDAATLLISNEKRLGDTAKLLTKQSAEVRKDLIRAEKNQQRAIKEATDEAKAMTLLMLDSQIQRQRNRLAQLDERLQIKLIDSRDRLKKSVADNRRAQVNQQDTISKLEIELANLRETRALFPPMRSPKPSGPGKTLIVLLSLVLGLILGLFAAFFAEFLSKARIQAQSVQNT